MTFYHGTSIAGLKVLLPPSETNIIREDFRKKNLGTVSSLLLAESLLKLMLGSVLLSLVVSL